MKYTKAIKLWHNWLLKKIPKSNFWEVKEEFYWYIDFENKRGKIIVPVWFKTNFWSIPRLLRIFFDPTKYIWYIVHDYLYSEEWVIELNDWWETWYTRKESDQILIATLNLESARIIEKFCIYIWVRIWWFLFYKNFLWKIFKWLKKDLNIIFILQLLCFIIILISIIYLIKNYGN